MYLWGKIIVMAYELTGKVAEIFPIQEVSATFKKREFVVERSEAGRDRVFTDYIKFQLLQDRVSLIDAFSVGEEIKVTFNIKGSKWEKDGRGGYITNLDAWRLEKASQDSAPVQGNEPASNATPLPEMEDDLPF